MAVANDVQAKGIVSRALPQIQPDTNSAYDRSDRYGGKYVSSIVPTKHLLADEGAYFTANLAASTTTFDSSNNYGIITTFASSSGLIYFKNNDQPGGKSVYLDYLRLVCATAAASATSMRLGVGLDSGNRTPTGGSASLIPVNTNMNSGVGSVGQIFGFSGAQMNLPGPVSQRLVGFTTLKQSIQIVGDEFLCYFGSVDPPACVGGTAAAITIAGKYASGLPPVVIGPQQGAILFQWNPGNSVTAPAYTGELAWWER